MTRVSQSISLSLLLLMFQECSSWMTHQQQSTTSLTNKRHGSSSLTMDVEGPISPLSKQTRSGLFRASSNTHSKRNGSHHVLPNKLIVPPPSRHSQQQTASWSHRPPSAPAAPSLTVQEAESLQGMPWDSSIDPSYPKAPFYMPFWNWQLEYMKKHLTNLKALPVTSSDQMTGKQDLSYVSSDHSSNRMMTLCFSSDEYRLIRMTLMDAGWNTQVFTSLWLPRGNLPVLGIDLLQFHKESKHLTIVDFQPIHDSEQEHDDLYEHKLQPIREQYPSLQGKMTQRFYDETQFFSNQMLFGREPKPDYVWDELMPAYQQYVQTHVEMAQTTMMTPSKMTPSQVLQRQAAYDDYSAARDPAHGLLAKAFGQEYADRFVYDVLFPLSSQPNRT
jgi:15,16-dihydrobiliverdin:ferredoxin oxidoreductase